MTHTNVSEEPLMGRVLDAVFNRHEIPLEDVVDRFFTPDYRQRTNGQWSNRTEVVAHLGRLRRVVERMDITVADELSDGERYADRHVLRVVKKDGSVTVQEVYVFALRDEDGRLRELHETTLMLEGDAGDRWLGQA